MDTVGVGGLLLEPDVQGLQNRTESGGMGLDVHGRLLLRDMWIGDTCDPIYADSWAVDVIMSAPCPIDAESFIHGLRAGGSDEDFAQYFTGSVVKCESSWRKEIISPEGYLGLSQFSWESWQKVASFTGYWNWWEAWVMGYNTAIWASWTDPASQWGCW